MRTKLVVGNWKMNLTQEESASVLTALLAVVDPSTPVEVGICPPYLSISKASEVLKGSKVFLGAQDVFWKDSGAFTGRVSAPMLKNAGVAACLIGHSETRGKFGKLETPESTVGFFAETDETVNLKIKALLAQGIVPILCCGETLAEREAGKTDEVIRTQIKGALAGISASEFATGVVAYEPVWAIGTGKVCESDEANRVCALVRTTLAEVLDAATAAKIRVLYGGSVKSSNAAELFAKSDIDGGLVGGASLDAAEFNRIIVNA